MGSSTSRLTKEEKAALAKSKKIETLNRAHHEKEEASKMKLLLLGTGESGKSTVLKQMKLLYGVKEGSTTDDRDKAKPHIYNTIYQNLRTVVENADKFGPVQNLEAKEALMALLQKANSGPAPVITPAVAADLKALWKDEGVQATWKARSNYQVQESLRFYMTEIDRIAAPGWLPSDQDMLQWRVRTTGIVEVSFFVDGMEFVMLDVGGQRNERKKWIHCFEHVTAVFFVAAISEYDQVLYEDATMNRFTETLDLFAEISNSKWFMKTPIILFLNKRDLFAEKLCEVPFKTKGRFEDFKGPHVEFGTKSAVIGTPENTECYEAALDYLRKQFLVRSTHGTEIYVHPTCATDQRNVQVVFNACKDIILRQKLQSSGFT